VIRYILLTTNKQKNTNPVINNDSMQTV